ncbi:hypothetical protein [Parasitella parasitica]|uniref:BHLH domain-containing protein n=1 Tax=Parasitella parasitica TaxID=35722 RepID=A0A0B7NCW0_9FUNG|nr:hypothetical protein [Parasitella parasitica]
MPSEKFRITTNGQSLRNPNNGFFGMTLSSNMTLDESDVSAHNDRRSAHNALERQRREHLNVKFQQLAHALPALQTVRRPSKTMIVAKSLEFVSSSLKRETTFTAEIQKLRLENEKLRKQAEISSNQLKRQSSKQHQKTNTTAATAAAPTTDSSVAGAKKKTEDFDDNVSETSTLVVKDDMKPSVKRKASISNSQLSPPPTPEAMRGSHKPHTVVIATPMGHQHKKKKMVKQTKSLPVVTVPSSMAQQFPVYIPATTTTATSTISMAHTPASSLIESPWSPLDDPQLHSSLLTYPPSTNNQADNTPNYFDMTSPSSSNANMLYDLYGDNMHPMLLSPYYIPPVEAATALYTTSFSGNANHCHQQQAHQRQHSYNAQNLYLS